MSAAFEVHNVLGAGFVEKVYENGLFKELRLRGLKVEQQKEVAVEYKGEEVGTYFADLLVEEKVIIEVKAVDSVSTVHEAQVINYLKASGFQVGLLLNFASPKLEYKRLVLSRPKERLS
ncbi:MAG: GxxExxY protein [Planctomycetes bacterium DG_23]|nr:MAG: GxxExxY protein [Planctomycetes bacterium DG_23]